jgi:hypothetical protein
VLAGAMEIEAKVHEEHDVSEDDGIVCSTASVCGCVLAVGETGDACTCVLGA